MDIIINSQRFSHGKISKNTTPIHLSDRKTIEDALAKLSNKMSQKQGKFVDRQAKQMAESVNPFAASKLKRLGSLQQPKKINIIKNEDVELRMEIRKNEEKMGEKAKSPQTQVRRQNRSTSQQKQTPSKNQRSVSTKNEYGSQTRKHIGTNLLIQKKFQQQEYDFPMFSEGQRTSIKRTSKISPQPRSKDKKSKQIKIRIGRSKKTNNQLEQSIQKREKSKKLQDEYQSRKNRMDSRLSEEVVKNSIVKEGITLKKVQFPPPPQSDLDLVPDRQGTDYTRSKRAVQMNFENKLESNQVSMQNDKTQIMNELNRRIQQLDQNTASNRNLNQELISKIKFVRDLQSSLGTADNAEISEIIDKDMEVQLRVEKQRNIELRETIKSHKKQLNNNQLDDLQMRGKTNPQLTSNISQVQKIIEKLLISKDQTLYECQQKFEEMQLMMQQLPEGDDANILLSEDFRQLNGQRDQLINEVQELQERYNAIYGEEEQRIRQQCNQFRRSKKKQSSLVLANMLNIVFKNKLQLHFTYLRGQGRRDYNQISSILAFRKICYKFSQRRQKKYLNKWFDQLKPYQLIKLNKVITNFIQKDQQGRKALTLWNHLRIVNQTERCHNTQLLKSQVTIIDNLNQKQMRRAYNLWFTCTKARKAGLQKLIRFISEKHSAKKIQAIFKWRQIVLNQSLMVRLHAQATRTAVYQFKTGLFYAWKIQTQFYKKQRIGLQLRVFKILTKNKQQNQLMKIQTMNIIRIQKKYAQNQRELVFFELKLSTEKDKYQAISEAKNQEEQEFNEIQTHVNNINSRNLHNKQMRAVNQSIINPFGKYLQSYFVHWKTITTEYRITLFKKIHSKIIQHYKDKLRISFTRLQNKGGKKKRRKMMKMNMEMENESVQLENDIRETTAKVQAEQVQSTKTGNQRFKKMLFNAYKSEMKYRLDQWKTMIKFQDKQKEVMQKQIIQNMNKRLFRQAFDIYKNKIQCLKKEEIVFDRTNEKLNAWKIRKMRNIFLGFAGNSVHMRQARLKFKKILITQANTISNEYFLRWVQFRDQDKDVKLQRKRKVFEEELQEVQALQNDHQDIILEQEKKNSEAVMSTNSLKRKVVKKTITNWIKYRQYWAWERWLKHYQHTQKQEKLLNQGIFTRMNHRIFRNAFSHWRSNMHKLQEESKNYSKKIEEENEQIQAKRIEDSRTSIAQIKEQRQHELTQIEEEQNYCKNLIIQQIKRSINDRQNYFIIKRKEHIFQTWRAIAGRNCRIMKNFVTFLTHNHKSNGFNGLVMADRNYLRNEHKTKYLIKLTTCIHNIKCRSAITLWGQKMFDSAQSHYRDQLQNKIHAGNNSDLKRAKLLDQRSLSFKERYIFMMRLRCFAALIDYKDKKVCQRNKHQVFLEKQQHVQMRYQFQKWVLRSDHAIIGRQKVKILKKYSNNKKTIRQVFEAIKYYSNMHSSLKKQLTRLFTNTTNIDLRFSFDNIIQQSEMKKYENNQKQVNAQNLMASIDKKQAQKHLQYWFNRFNNYGLTQSQKYKNVGQIFQRKISRFYRDAFNKWKKNSDMLEVIRFNNEEGPEAMKLFEVNSELNNLKFMIKDFRMMNEDQISDCIKDDDNQYLQKVNKVRIRLNLFGEGNRNENDNWLLPYCFDRLKMNKNWRKCFGEGLKNFNINYGTGDYNNMCRAFLKWKKQVARMIAALMGLTQEQLFDRQYRNTMTLKDLAEQLEEAAIEIGDLKTQREYLIEKVVLGQRLALARIRFSYSFCLEKSWVKFEKNCNDGASAGALAEIGAAINEIGEIKERMTVLENENNDITEQNDGFKEGAQEGVDNLEQLTEVQEEVEELNNQVSEQADELKELLALNKKLKDQLEEYE